MGKLRKKKEIPKTLKPLASATSATLNAANSDHGSKRGSARMKASTDDKRTISISEQIKTGQIKVSQNAKKNEQR